VDVFAVVGASTGVVGALTGGAALALQIIAQRRSGRLVTVTASYVMPVYGPTHAPEFHDDDQVGIVVTNHGGAPVTVINYGVAIGGKSTNLFVTERPVWGTKLPSQVEPGGVPVQLLVPVADLRRTHRETRTPYNKMFPWVDLGDGRRVFAKTPVPLE
jgi:hypothetical protein